MIMESNTYYLRKSLHLLGKNQWHTMHYQCMIITLQPSYSIPLLDRKKTKGEYLNNKTKHLYKIPIPSHQN